MAERRSLVHGIKTSTPPLDPAVENEFVYGKTTPQAAQPKTNKPAARTPLSSKIRTDFAAALKRASLERQLKGIYPNTLQDIIEEALEPWLKSNGYLP
jgi:cell pole-organizing protein PopZ